MRHDLLACQANQQALAQGPAPGEIGKPSLGAEILPALPAQGRMVHRGWLVLREKIEAQGAIAGAVRLALLVRSVIRAQARVRHAHHASLATRCRVKLGQEKVGHGPMQDQAVLALVQTGRAAVVASVGAAGAAASHRARAKGRRPIAQAARAQAARSSSRGGWRLIEAPSGLDISNVCY